MQRGKIRVEQALTASICQTVIRMHRDPKTKLPTLDDLKIFELLPYDYDGSARKPQPTQHRPFSELKQLFGQAKE